MTVWAALTQRHRSPWGGDRSEGILGWVSIVPQSLMDEQKWWERVFYYKKLCLRVQKKLWAEYLCIQTSRHLVIDSLYAVFIVLSRSTCYSLDIHIGTDDILNLLWKRVLESKGTRSHQDPFSWFRAKPKHHRQHLAFHLHHLKT